MHFHKHLVGLAAVVAGLVGSTFAGTLTNVSITGSDLNPGATSDYTFTYTVETAVPNGDWAFCISTNPWEDSLGLFQHPLSISVDGNPFNNDNSGVFGLLGPNGSYCRSINTDVDSGSVVSATISSLVNPSAGSYQIYLLTYNGSILDTLSGSYYNMQIGNPISSCDDLANINNDLTRSYTLTQDLDCSGSGNSIMIGSNISPFLGSFDGGNHSITVAFDTGYSGTYGGLFRYITAGGSLSNLTVLGTVHLDATEVGGVVGKAWLATLTNVHFSGTIVVGENQISIGGIAGRLEDSTLSGSSAHGTVQALLNSSTVGGLVGLMSSDAIIRYSYADNDVSGYYNVGGLVGEGYGSSIIENSYAAGDIESRAQHGGGIIGYADQTFINDSYALGDVYATDNAGGLAGNTRGLYVTNAYAAGAVYTGTAYAGGLFGGFESGPGSIPNVATGYFWDMETSNMSSYFMAATGALDGTTGLTTSQMQNVNNFIDAGWDFTGTWDLNSARNNYYPFLQWQTFDTPRGSEVNIYMNDSGPVTSASRSISIQYTNSQDADLTGVVLTLYGEIYSTGYQEASGGNNPTFSGIVEGSYIQWVIPSFSKGATGELDLLITQPVDGSYVYTATIAAPYNTEYYIGNNSFSITSTVDTVTESPQIIAPIALSSHQRGQAMPISFVLPEILLSHSLHLLFVPQDTGQQTIDLQLMDANQLVTNTFNITPSSNLLAVTEVVSGNASSIPNGTYNVILSYQDAYGNAAATAMVSNVTIIDNVSNGGGGNGGGGGGGGFISQDSCPNGDASSSSYDGICGNVLDTWKLFYATFSSGGVSSASGSITVKSFVTDVFKLLHITKPMHRQADSDTKIVPEKLIIKVMQILQKLLSK